MDKHEEIEDAMKEVLMKIQALQEFVDKLLRDNSDAEFVGLLLESIKKRNTFH